MKYYSTPSLWTLETHHRIISWLWKLSHQLLGMYYYLLQRQEHNLQPINIFKNEKNNLHYSFGHPKISLNIITWKIIFQIHSNFGKHFTCYSKKWSENFSAVREMFFFQKGDLHNSFGRSVHVLGWLASVANLQRVQSNIDAHATTPQLGAPRHSSLLNKGCLNSVDAMQEV